MVSCPSDIYTTMVSFGLFLLPIVMCELLCPQESEVNKAGPVVWAQILVTTHSPWCAS